jgi:hypothetical protein
MVLDDKGEMSRVCGIGVVWRERDTLCFYLLYFLFVNLYMYFVSHTHALYDTLSVVA